MIYDRTISDVDLAKQLVEDKIKKFVELTDSERETLERGMMTINTLNRIENKQAEVKALLNNEGYFGGSINNKSWEIGNYFMLSDLERLANNSALLRKYLKVYADTPSDPKPLYHYEEINKMEKILVDLEKLVDELKARYRRCNTFRCGEVFV